MSSKKINNITGAGGGKAGSPPTEVKDNRFSSVIARVLTAYSSGTTGGLVDGEKSIFLNETRLQAADDSYNFQGVTIGETDGTGFVTVSPPPPGPSFKGTLKPTARSNFTNVTNTVNINTSVEFGTPIIRTVSDVDVDAVRIIMTMLSLQKIESDGDIKGTSIQIQLEVRDPGAGIWENRGTKTIVGKSSGPFQQQFRIAGPDTITAAWDWRVTRLTADSTSSRLSNDSTVQAAVELFYGSEDYIGTSAIGVEIATEDFGNTLPSVAFEVSGVKVRVPSNYNLVAGIPGYTGIWDGTFKFESTSNPVWHIYHLIIDDEIGLGLDESFVDRYNFYEAAQYCDAVDGTGTFVGVDDGAGGVRRRFTFNTQIRGQKDGIEMLQEIASSMRAILYFGAGAVVLKQDAPRATARIVTNDNVKDGSFAYSSTSAKDRITVAKVSYNDPDDFFKLRYVVYPKQEDWATDANILRFGRNETEVVKLGCASEAEAEAYAKWIVYTSVNEDRTVTFIGSPEFLLTRPGDVLEIADRRLAGAANFDQRYGGRIAGGTLTTVDLDYPIELAVGETYTITIIGADGTTLETRDITTVAGVDISTVTVSVAFSAVPTTGFTWLVTGTDIAPQKFSVINIERKEGLEVELFCIKYDETKFAAVESGIILTPKPYTKIDVTNPLPPTTLTFQVAPRMDELQGTMNSLIVRWTASATELVTRYKVSWSRENEIPTTSLVAGGITEFTIPNVTAGVYKIVVVSVNPLGYESVALTGSKTITYADGTYDWEGVASTILPPTITSSATFGGKDLKVEWTRDAANDQPGIVLKDYVVEFSTDATLRRRKFTTDLYAEYLYDEQLADLNNVPNRAISVVVKERDAYNRESADATLAMSNPTPTAPSFTLNPGFNTVYVDITPSADIDIAGYVVFKGTSPAFTANDASVVYKGPSPSYTDNALGEATTYYYKVAAYDQFDDTVANLTISGELNTTTVTVKGSIVDYNFEGLEFSEAANVVTWTAGTVYELEGGVVTTTAITGGNDTWTTGTLYFFWDPVAEIISTDTDLANLYQTGEARRIVATYDGTILREGTNKPIFDGADIIANTVGATQVVTSGLITNSAQINDAVIQTANIGDLQVDTIKIASGAVTQPDTASTADTTEYIGSDWSGDGRWSIQVMQPRGSVNVEVTEAAGLEPEEYYFARISRISPFTNNDQYNNLGEDWQDTRYTYRELFSTAAFLNVPGSDFVTKNPNYPAPTSITPTGALSNTLVTYNGVEYREIVWDTSGSLEVQGGMLRGVQYFALAGGGGGGYDGGGGGGGGGVISNTYGFDVNGQSMAIAVGKRNTTSTHTITIGTGGAGSAVSTAAGTKGNDSIIAFDNEFLVPDWPDDTLGVDPGTMAPWYYSTTEAAEMITTITVEGGGGGGSNGTGKDGTGGGCGGGGACGSGAKGLGNNLYFGVDNLCQHQGGPGGDGSPSTSSTGRGGGGGGATQVLSNGLGETGVDGSTLRASAGLGFTSFFSFTTLPTGSSVTDYARGGFGGRRSTTGLPFAPTTTDPVDKYYGHGGYGGNTGGGINGTDGTKGLVAIRFPTDQEALRPYTAHYIDSTSEFVFADGTTPGTNMNDVSLFYVHDDAPSPGYILSRYTSASVNPYYSSGDSIEVEFRFSSFSTMPQNGAVYGRNRSMAATWIKFFR